MTPQTLGTHKDYVRALAFAPKANWLASGSFDKTIKVWDLKEMRSTPIFTISEPALRTSIYALAVNSPGTILAAASPEKTIQLWDPRSRQQISQLVGHRDNVRSVVLSQDGSHLLSASSDSTIKLWSIGEQRCLHTFTHHNDSVWSLFSDHESLDVFYSGDRSGVVCKVDWERCNEVSEGECVVLAKEKSKEGELKFNRGCPSDAKAAGIYKIIALDNAYFWTTNSNSEVKRYKDVQPRWKREAIYPIESQALHFAGPIKQTKTASSYLATPAVPARPSALKSHASSFNQVQTSVSFADDASSSLRSGSPFPSTARDQSYDDDKGQQSATLYGLPFASLVCLANDSFGAAIGLGSTLTRTLERRDSITAPSAQNMFSSSSLISIPSVLKAAQQDSYRSQGESSLGYSPVAHIASAAQARFLDARPSSTRSASIRFAPLSAAFNDTNPGSFQEYDADADIDRDAHEARQAYEERDSAADASPLRTAPEDSIVGSHGLIRHSMLNDRRHVLAINSAGQIFLWDIICAQCLGAFDWEEVAQIWSQDESSSKEEYLLPGDALDIIKDRIQGEGAAPMWCTVDTITGSLSVHFDYPRCFDAEIYLDEMADILHKNGSTLDSKDDARVNIARLVLRNLFDGFVNGEAALRGEGSTAGLTKGQLAMEKPKTASKKPNLKLELGRRLQHAADSVQTPRMTVALAVAPKTPAILPIASPLTPQPRTEMPSMQQLLKTDGNATSGEAANSQHAMDDYFSMNNNNGANYAIPQTPQPKTPSAVAFPTSPTSPGGGLLGRFKMTMKRGGEQNKREEKGTLPAANNATASTETEEEVKGEQSEGKQKLDIVRKILNMADPTKVLEDMPRIPFPPQTTIMIIEASSESVDFHVDYMGLAKSTEADLPNLEIVSPPWLLEFLVGASDHSPPVKDKDKLTFLLMPWEDPSGKVGTMPEMPTGNSRLTATKMLRAKKACIYVAEKLEIVGKDKVEAHDMIELVCNGVVVPSHSTLAQIQRFYWKSSNVLTLSYRERR
jgi:WD repeat-containing protein 48